MAPGPEPLELSIAPVWLEILQHSPHALAIVRPDADTLARVSPAFARLHGRTTDELVGRPLIDLYAPAWRARVAALGAEADARGHLIFEAEHVRGDGTAFPVMVDVTVVREEGWSTFRLASVYDMSDVRRIDAELAAALAREQKLRAEAERRSAELLATIQSIPDAVYIGTERGMTLANEPALRQLGFRSYDDLSRDVGVLSREIFTRHADTGEKIAPEDEVFSRALRGERGVREVIVRDVETGEDRIVRSAGAPVIVDGRITGAVAVNTDITGARRAADRSARLLAVTSALTRARSATEVADIILGQSLPALGAIAGAVAEIAPGGTEYVLLHSVGYSEETRARYRRFPVDAALPTRDFARHGAPVFVESSAQWDESYAPLETLPARDDARAWAALPLAVDGRVIGALTVSYGEPRAFPAEARDFAMTLANQCAQALERARLLEREHAARAEAETANQAKMEFLVRMSHELRTPLNAIGGYAELLELGVHGPATAAQRDALRRIRLNQRHLVSLINDVLGFAKLEAGHVALDIGDIPGDQLLAGLDALIAPQVQEKALRFELHPCASPLVARGDPEKVRQVLLNLLSNAVKFTGRGGAVIVRCEAHHASVAVLVRDTGVGIPAESLERIFQPFVQVSATPGVRSEGTGLGLAISRDLARAMGGDLTVESRPGEGSTFTLLLPRASSTGARP